MNGRKQVTKLTAEDRLRRRREELGLSRRQVAEMTELPVSRIWASEQPGLATEEVRAIIVAALNQHVEKLSKLAPIV